MVLKVKDPTDQAAPVVVFAPELGLAAVTDLTEIRGRVSDINLDEWTLEVATLGSDEFTVLATGTTTISDEALATFNPAMVANGLYQVRLTATDMGGRTSQTETVLEVNQPQKSQQ